MPEHPFSLDDKTIFVTGASSGIGRAIAIECSKLGAKLIITGRDEKRLDDTFSDLQGSGHIQFRADLSSVAEITALIKSLPLLDGFVCNAGVNKLLPIQFITEKELGETFQINSIAPILLTKNLVKRKKLKNPSSIVYISSIAGVFSASPANSMYSASKGAMNGFMKNAALDLAKKGIRCNSVNPGFIKTNLSDIKELKEDQLEKHLPKYPIKRFGTPEDVAYATIYLLSDASSWVTGAPFLIDGGYTIQ
jgi:NAD(P)-dependent dehydrogenase (short-subunit alcohol dehydrogenase family)